MSEIPQAQLKDVVPREPRRIALIVAMEREAAPLLRLWREEGQKPERKSISILKGYVSDGAWVIFSGIGRKAAAVATRVVIEYHKPELIISAGLAGALRNDLAAGTVIRPAMVIDASNGEKYGRTGNNGVEVLVTAGSVLTREEKQRLAQRFHGDAVDMEAAVVAEIARAAGIPFVAVKAISDALDFPMPPLGRFIDANGQVNLLKLIGFAALRPQIWRALFDLQRNSQLAAEALAVELKRVIAE
jgi:adenosylhomocysteine nucleosidase